LGGSWLALGNAQLLSWLAGWAPVGGVALLSLLCAWMAASLFYLLQGQRLMLVPLLLPWLLGLILQQISWTQISGTLTLSAVQGNVPAAEKWQTDSAVWIERYMAETRQHWDSDLVVWPETAITVFYPRDRDVFDAIAAEARSHQTAIISGVPSIWEGPQGSRQFHNSLIAMGTGHGIYHKQKMVPLAEYTPPIIRALLKRFNISMHSFAAGKPQQPLLQIHVDGQIVPVAPFICYDLSYANRVAQDVRNAGLLLGLSNDGWFGDSSGLHQHLGMARMRALETQRSMIAVNSTGITASIDFRGHLRSQLPVAQIGTLTDTVAIRQGRTPFMICGYWPLIILSSVLFLLASRGRRKTAADAASA